MNGNPKLIANWLFGVAAMVLAMAVIGAVTRLTESGLSMVEWRPLMGAVPPTSAAGWQDVFDAYRETPEYQKKNFGMSLEEFKFIFFWEWFHRLWGRLIGLALLLPLIVFGAMKLIPKGYAIKIFGIGLLVAGQAVMGYFMVKSGLIDRPSVSHFRLAAHLSLAFLIFSCLIWVAWDLRSAGRYIKSYSGLEKIHGWGALALTFITIIWGAFVAGLDAGLLYNTYPLMDGAFFPAGKADIVNDHGWVQFFHRWVAIAAAALVLSFAFRIQSWPLAGMIVLQVGFGISTLLSQVWLPLASIHQAGAFILIAILIYNLRRMTAS